MKTIPQTDDGAIIEELDGCSKLGPDELLAQRRAKFLAIG